MHNVLNIIIQLFIILLTAPLLDGVIRKVKALTQKRRGAPLLQMYLDIYKLLRKQAVVSETSSWIFRATPYIVIATSLGAAAMVPVVTRGATGGLIAAGFPGDIFLLVYLLALGRFFMMLSALDTGSTFGGMGSSREALISALMEPSVLVSLFTAGLVAGTTSLSGILQKMNDTAFPLSQPVFILMAISLLIIILAETARIPVDDPATHLELTMVHEAMVLEYSGRHLALMELGASVKQLVFITLLVNICVPHEGFIAFGGIAAVLLSLVIWLAKVLLAALLIAVAEVTTVKFRFFSVPNLAALSFILAFVGFLQYFVLR